MCQISNALASLIPAKTSYVFIQDLMLASIEQYPNCNSCINYKRHRLQFLGYSMNSNQIRPKDIDNEHNRNLSQIIKHVNNTGATWETNYTRRKNWSSPTKEKLGHWSKAKNPEEKQRLRRLQHGWLFLGKANTGSSQVRKAKEVAIGHKYQWGQSIWSELPHVAQGLYALHHSANGPDFLQFQTHAQVYCWD